MLFDICYGYSCVSYKTFWNGSKKFETLENKIWICQKLNHPCTLTFKQWLFVTGLKDCVYTCAGVHNVYAKAFEQTWKKLHTNFEIPLISKILDGKFTEMFYFYFTFTETSLVVHLCSYVWSPFCHVCVLKVIINSLISKFRFNLNYKTSNYLRIFKPPCFCNTRLKELTLLLLLKYEKGICVSTKYFHMYFHTFL